MKATVQPYVQDSMYRTGDILSYIIDLADAAESSAGLRAKSPCVCGASSEAVQAPTTTPAHASPLMPTQVMLSPAQGAQQYASSQVPDYEISQQQQPVSVFVELQQKPSACSKSTKQKIAVASGGAIFVLGVIAAVVTLATRSDSPSSQQHTAGVPAPAP
eukprot:COSAG01_NODE_23350_length_818_cov_2.100139_1_plen_159_part_01